MECGGNHPKSSIPQPRSSLSPPCPHAPGTHKPQERLNLVGITSKGGLSIVAHLDPSHARPNSEQMTFALLTPPPLMRARTGDPSALLPLWSSAQRN